MVPTARSTGCRPRMRSGWPAEAQREVDRVFAEIPFGIPNEPLPSKEALGFRVPLYGFDRWSKLFTPRQLFALGTFVKHTRRPHAMSSSASADDPDETVAVISL